MDLMSFYTGLLRLLVDEFIILYLASKSSRATVVDMTVT